MKKTLLILAVAALPLFGQEPAQSEAVAPQGNAPQSAVPAADPRAAFMEKFDTNKDGKLDDQEKAAAKAAFEARREERKKQFMEKFDTNKDGKLDDQEKAAVKAAFEARREEGKKQFMEKFTEKFDTNKDGKLDDQEKAAAKAAFDKPHAWVHIERRAHRPQGCTCCPCGQAGPRPRPIKRVRCGGPQGPACGQPCPQPHPSKGACCGPRHPHPQGPACGQPCRPRPMGGPSDCPGRKPSGEQQRESAPLPVPPPAPAA